MALHLTASSLRLAALCFGFRQQVSLGVRWRDFAWQSRKEVVGLMDQEIEKHRKREATCKFLTI